MVTQHQELDAMLTRLKLATIRNHLDSLLGEAARRKLSMRDTVGMLCARELAHRNEQRIVMLNKLARFPAPCDLASFDFAAQPSVDKAQIEELASGRWIAHGDSVLLLGPPGVGKTHLATGLGRAAIKEGYPTLFLPAAALAASLVRAHAEGRLEERLIILSKPRLLIVDELGYLPLEPQVAHLFFQLVSRRYERGSVLITSNRSVGEWGNVFGDPVVATAILAPADPPPPRLAHGGPQGPPTRAAPPESSARSATRAGPYCGLRGRPAPEGGTVLPVASRSDSDVV